MVLNINAARKEYKKTLIALMLFKFFLRYVTDNNISNSQFKNTKRDFISPILEKIKNKKR